ncbi:non-specific lipid-transfer protein-like protein At2g13820 isoform X1 [Vigna radiata var. radiata]|uniref:Non-specific lipid-transfer protein-like protein At2g13820 isoform X1 n=1 Tax=Vigna radiata var. radiata TaxID=3916 RepID=A0A1S3TP28_VIGRR|nr:non-specific lipid-transfer protein-like protein At2g13820 isoform X1 [Vigna radiata var. radiata]
MAPRRIEMLLRLCLVMALWGGTLAQSQSSCTNVFISLAPCLDYVTGNVSNPSSSCCSQLAYVVSSQPLCLCEVVSGAASTIAASFNINQTRALALPTSCNIQTPPLTTCTGSPAFSVSNFPNSPSGIGSNTVSSATGSSTFVGGSSHQNSSSTSKLSCSWFLMFVLATTLTFTFKSTTSLNIF